MRLVCWNVNGLRTLKGFQPWYALPTWEACLEGLEADIACFQEVKMTRKQLQSSMCVMEGYEAFYDLHPTKGYSGTVSYVKKELCMPIRAETGITGRTQAIGAEAMEIKQEITPDIYTALDREGRSVILDCGLFVLINVYAPNETGPERVEYKMAFYHTLHERIQNLRRENREVIVVGDMNVVAYPIDHCEAAILPRKEQEEFFSHPARTWYRELIAPNSGILIDITRKLHPAREKMYTCWNTLIDARPANYGTRLDYTLITPGLLPWVAHADIQPEIYGSDHCPVFLELHDTLEIDGEEVKLSDLMHGLHSTSPGTPLRLAASQYAEFSARTQPKILSMFQAQGQARSQTASQKDLGKRPSASSERGTSDSYSSLSKDPNSDTSPNPTQKDPPLQADSSLAKRLKVAKQESPQSMKGSPERNKRPITKKNVAMQPNLTQFFGGKPRSTSKEASLATDSATEAARESCVQQAEPMDLNLLIPETSSRQTDAEEKWNSLFTPHPPPLCNAHNQPARSWIVNKPGINHGRKFWLCSRPVGPGYQSNKGAEASNSAYRCNYFAWDSDVKRRHAQ